MSTIIEILTAAALILSIIIPGGAFLLGERNKKTLQKISGSQLFLLLWHTPCRNHRHVRRCAERTGCY